MYFAECDRCIIRDPEHDELCSGCANNKRAIESLTTTARIERAAALQMLETLKHAQKQTNQARAYGDAVFGRAILGLPVGLGPPPWWSAGLPEWLQEGGGREGH